MTAVPPLAGAKLTAGRNDELATWGSVDDRSRSPPLAPTPIYNLLRVRPTLGRISTLGHGSIPTEWKAAPTIRVNGAKRLPRDSCRKLVVSRQLQLVVIPGPGLSGRATAVIWDANAVRPPPGAPTANHATTGVVSPDFVSRAACFVPRHQLRVRGGLCSTASSLGTAGPGSFDRAVLHRLRGGGGGLGPPAVAAYDYFPSGQDSRSRARL